MEPDLSKGILESIDMDSYRVEKKAAIHVQLQDEDAEIAPVPTTGGGHRPEPELDRLSNILQSFNDQFGNIPWTDGDRVHRLITEEIPNRVAADTAYQNAKQNSDKQNARIEHDKAPPAGDDGATAGRHGVVQAIQRQRVIPAVVDGYDVLDHLRGQVGVVFLHPSSSS